MLQVCNTKEVIKQKKKKKKKSEVKSLKKQINKN